MSRPILITGANGFLGSYLCREFSASGYRVHGLCRAGSDRSNLAGLDLPIHEADVRDPVALRAALEAFTPHASDGLEPWLVHNAARISYRKRDRELQEAVNHQGTRNVLAAAREVGVRRFLHVSSVVAVGVARGGATLDEQSPWNAEGLGIDYVRTKRRAEEAALEVAEELDVRVVNPGAIFGPVSSSSNTLRFLRQLDAGRIGTLAPPGGMSVVGVEDCARGARLALERGRTGRRYVLVESHLSALELFTLARTLLHGPGARRPLGAVPAWLWSCLGPLARCLEWRDPDTLLSRQTLFMLGQNFRFRGDRARRELGWDPTPFPRVLQDTITDLRRQGALPFRADSTL